MNQSMNEYVSNTMPPMTPSLKRKRNAVTMMTPARSLKKSRVANTTPVRSRTEATQKWQQQTMMTPSLRRRRHPCGGTPAASLTGGADRFIPNRAKTDVAKARHAMLHSHQNNGNHHIFPPSTLTTTKLNDYGSGVEYQRSLRRVLFGENDNPETQEENSRILSFGSSTTTRTKTPSRRIHPNDPRDLDSLRCRDTRQQRRPKITIRNAATLDAPGMLDDANLSLMSSNGDTMVIALDDLVYLCRGFDKKVGNVELLAQLGKEDEEKLPFSSVRWSESGDLIALGSMDSIAICKPSLIQGEGGNHMMLRNLSCCEGYVTAIAWKDSEIVAVGEDAIKRCNLSEAYPRVSTYQHDHGEFELVTALEWKHNWIVSAGGNTINIWHDEQQGDHVEPCLVLDHSGVKTIEFCPFQSNLLVSGGDNGLKFWNINDGSLRGTIKTGQRVVGTVFSKENNEVAVAHGNKLSVWSINGKVSKLAEAPAKAGTKFIHMTAGLKGTVVCATDDESITVYEINRGPTTGRKLSFGLEMGALKIPVIR